MRYWYVWFTVASARCWIAYKDWDGFCLFLLYWKQSTEMYYECLILLLPYHEIARLKYNFDLTYTVVIEEMKITYNMGKQIIHHSVWWVKPTHFSAMKLLFIWIILINMDSGNMEDPTLLCCLFMKTQSMRNKEILSYMQEDCIC